MVISYLTVSMSNASIRVVISATHTEDDLDYGVEKFAKIGRKLGFRIAECELQIAI